MATIDYKNYSELIKEPAAEVALKGPPKIERRKVVRRNKANIKRYEKERRTGSEQRTKYRRRAGEVRAYKQEYAPKEKIAIRAGEITRRQALEARNVDKMFRTRTKARIPAPGIASSTGPKGQSRLAQLAQSEKVVSRAVTKQTAKKTLTGLLGKLAKVLGGKALGVIEPVRMLTEKTRELDEKKRMQQLYGRSI